MRNKATIILITMILAACDTTERPAVDFMRMGGQGMMHFVYIGPDVNGGGYRQVVNYICDGERICIVHFWNDPGFIPTGLPMTEAQVNAKVAHYNLNKNTNLNRLAFCSGGGC